MRALIDVEITKLEKTMLGSDMVLIMARHDRLIPQKPHLLSKLSVDRVKS